MRPKLRQLHNRVETSYRLLVEAIEEEQKTQREIDTLSRCLETSVQRPYHDWSDSTWHENDVFDTEKLFREQRQRESLRDVLRDNREEVEACVRSYGISACREVSQYMFEYMPRELRDMVYHEINRDPHTAGHYHDDDNDENSTPGLKEYLRRDQNAKHDKLDTPLDYRFVFFKRHYFQASYMGSGFVRELADAHFRATPFKIQLEELFSKRGHQDFFLFDKYGLGFPLGQLLSRVEVIITSLDHSITDHLQPLMAIANTECIIELTSPGPLTIFQDFGQKDVVATQDVFLERIALNLRRMKLKGYCVRVWYQGKLIYAVNEYDQKKPGEAFHTRNRSRILSALTKRRPTLPSQTLVDMAAPNIKITPHPREANPTITKSIFGQQSAVVQQQHDHDQAILDEEGLTVSGVPSRHPVGSSSTPTTIIESHLRNTITSATFTKEMGTLNNTRLTATPSNDENSCNSSINLTRATSAPPLKRPQDNQSESLDDIKAFYEKRRAEVRAFFESRKTQASGDGGQSGDEDRVA